MTRRQLKIAYAMALAVWGAAMLIWFALNQLRVRLYDSAIHEPESLSASHFHTIIRVQSVLTYPIVILTVLLGLILIYELAHSIGKPLSR